MANTSVDLGDHFNGFLQQLKASGRYRNNSEAVRAGLRLLEKEEADLQATHKYLEQELIAAEKSGMSNRTHAEIIAEAKEQLSGQ
ncbi:type II toxin-antitoxin system ParD family antitoxin [Porticoccus sp. GXU_MW_L64]